VVVATSFRWRHRFLRAGVADAEALSGIVEADETFFRRSFKGSRCWRKQADPPPRPPKRRATPARKRGLSDEQVPVLVTRDRTGSTRAAVLADRSADAIDVAIGASLPADGVLCTDSHAAFRLVADRHAIHHEPVNSRLKSWSPPSTASPHATCPTISPGTMFSTKSQMFRTIVNGCG